MNFPCEHHHKLALVVGGVAAAAVAVIVVKKLTKREKKKEYPRDTAIVHQIGPGPYAPSMTPFAVKLETYLRVAKIPYESEHGFQPSSKGKFPWMEYNGEAVADTTLCIEFINMKLGIDINKHLSPSEKAVGLAMKIMFEEHFYWGLLLHRWCYNNDKTMLKETFKMGKVMLWMVKRWAGKSAWGQGMGRHTQEEVIHFMKKDLESLRDYIGKKKFLFGNTASEYDCAVFGQLSQMYWNFLGTGLEHWLRDEFPSLADYCERMKETFWPDWDQCIIYGEKRETVG